MKQLKIVKIKAKSIMLTIPLAFSLYPYKAHQTPKITEDYFYRNGNIFFDVGDLVNHHDVLVFDHRDSDDSDMEINNSYKILSLRDQKEIIEQLLQYDNCESNWNRTMESMQAEWFFHNVGYYLGINKERTGSVNFSNADEKKYKLLLK